MRECYRVTGVHGRARQSPARELRGGGHVAHLSGVGAQDRRGRLTIEGSRSVNNIILVSSGFRITIVVK